MTHSWNAPYLGTSREDERCVPTMLKSAPHARDQPQNNTIQTSNQCAIATQILEARRAPHFNVPNVRKPMVKGMPMLPLNTRQETVPTCAEASIFMNITRREWCQRCGCHRNRKPMNNQLPANASTATWENVRRTITSHL